MTHLTIARIWMACGCAAVLACQAAARGPTSAPARAQVTADPNDPGKTRTIIPREERERLGLTPRTWSGVVDPEVLARFDRLDKTVASLKDKMTKEKDVKAFNSLWRIRFKGMVYVEVQLKDQDAQRRLLASLKASEFYPECVFQSNAGLTGYVSKDGLDKISKHADVTGVCLDDKPLPAKGAVIFKEHVAPPKPGENTSEMPGVPEKKVDPDVYRLLELHE